MFLSTVKLTCVSSVVCLPWVSTWAACSRPPRWTRRQSCPASPPSHPAWPPPPLRMAPLATPPHTTPCMGRTQWRATPVWPPPLHRLGKLLKLWISIKCVWPALLQLTFLRLKAKQHQAAGGFTSYSPQPPLSPRSSSSLSACQYNLPPDRPLI